MDDFSSSVGGADFILTIVEIEMLNDALPGALDLLVDGFGKTAIEAVVGEGESLRGVLYTDESVEGIICVGCIPKEAGIAVRVILGGAELVEIVKGICFIIFLEAVKVGVIGIGVACFFNELIEIVVGIRCALRLGLNSSDIADGIIINHVLRKVRGGNS